MDCTDSWLLTGEHVCSICQRDIFLTPYAPDQESNGVTAIEHISLLKSADDGDNSVTNPMSDHRIGNFERTYSCFNQPLEDS